MAKKTAYDIEGENVQPCGKYDIRAVKNAMTILKEIAYIGKPAGLLELSRAINFNSNLTFRLLSTMIGEGIIEKVGDKYGLGYLFAAIYSKYVRGIKKIRDDANLKLINLGE